MHDLSSLASAFLNIFESHRLYGSFEHIGSLSIEEAYRVQRMAIDNRISKGERLVGYKVGCTSEAIRNQFGLTEPICGCLMAPHFYHGEKVLNWSDYCQPAVEPEFVLHIGKDFPDEVGENESLDHAIEFVSPGIEVHNYRFWFGEPTLQELIASNGIHAALIVGEAKMKPQEFEWDLEGVDLLKNGELAAAGMGSDIMGGPMKSLRWLVNHLVRRGDMLQPGQVVIPGSPVELVSVQSGDEVTARFTHVGSANAIFR